jgi:hypothetical protein
VTAAYDYEDIHHLVDRLTPLQVRRLRLLVTQDEALSQAAVAERFGVDRVATLDRRHFSVVKPAHVPALTLLPWPTRWPGLRGLPPPRSEQVPGRPGARPNVDTGSWS